MRISGVKAGEEQLPLWRGAFDVAITAKGSTRNHCGEFFERLAAELLNARRHKTDATCEYCPDLSAVDMGDISGAQQMSYVESKSVGKTGHVILYRKRRENDRAFVAGGRRLYYFCFHHKARVYEAATTDDLFNDLAAKLRFATLCEFATIDRLAELQPLKVLNKSKALGYGRNGYGDGYTILATSIRASCSQTCHVPIWCQNRGVKLGNFPIHCTPGAARFLRAAGRVLF